MTDTNNENLVELQTDDGVVRKDVLMQAFSNFPEMNVMLEPFDSIFHKKVSDVVDNAGVGLGAVMATMAFFMADAVSRCNTGREDGVCVICGAYGDLVHQLAHMLVSKVPTAH